MCKNRKISKFYASVLLYLHTFLSEKKIYIFKILHFLKSVKYKHILFDVQFKKMMQSRFSPEYIGSIIL